VIAHYLGHLGGLTAIEERVRFARRRFGHYDVVDFVVNVEKVREKALSVEKVRIIPRRHMYNRLSD
jgi:hypothetical protein